MAIAFPTTNTPTPPGKPDPRPTPPVPPRVIETSGADLPKVIYGTIEDVDISRAAYWADRRRSLRDKRVTIVSHCVVAMAIRRMFPFVPVSRIIIGSTKANIGGRLYYVNKEGTKGICEWHGTYWDRKFNFILTSPYG